MISKNIFSFIFSAICGLLVAEILREFGYYFYGFLFIFLPILSVVCLFMAEYFGKKFLFVFQISKHILVGVFATIIDLKVFELLFWALSFDILVKTFSFIISVCIKYIGNKFWTFKKTEEGITKFEFFKFFITNLVGLVIDVLCFIILTRFFSFEARVSVLISAIIAGIWNFCMDKFFVFKK